MELLSFGAEIAADRDLGAFININESPGLTVLWFLPAVVTPIFGSYNTHLQIANTPAPSPPYCRRQHAISTFSLRIPISFFLFSVQVREDTIFIPLLPLTLLLSGVAPTYEISSRGALATMLVVFPCHHCTPWIYEWRTHSMRSLLKRWRESPVPFDASSRTI